MAITSVPRIVVAGSSSGAGKSLLVTGLLMALRRRGMSVSCCTTQAAFQQSVIYSRITHRYVRCLDPQIFSREEITQAIGYASLGADIVLIDGADGVYDGRGVGDVTASDAELAAFTETPTLLVMNTPKISNSLLAVTKGFTEFTSTRLIQGLILNRLGEGLDPRSHYLERERAAFEEDLLAYNMPVCDGYIPFSPLKGCLPPRQVVQQSNYTAIPLKFLSELEQLVNTYVNVDDIVQLAALAQPLEYEDLTPVVKRGECRIAVADDSCCNIGFQDNLDLLRIYGADIVKFSPMTDSSLPGSIGAVYMPGASLSEYAETIGANRELYAALRSFYERGGIIFSEGAGTAILCDSFRPASSNITYQGVGLIPVEAVETPMEYSRFEASVIQDSVLGEMEWRVAGVSTGEWRAKSEFVGDSAEALKTLRIELPSGLSVREGFAASGQSFGTFHFIHFGSNPMMAASLVKAAATHQKNERIEPSRE